MHLGSLFRSIKRDLDIEMKLLVRQEDIRQKKEEEQENSMPFLRESSKTAGHQSHEEEKSFNISFLRAQSPVDDVMNKSGLSFKSIVAVRSCLKKNRELRGLSKPFKNSFNYSHISRSASMQIANRLSIQKSLIRQSSKSMSSSRANKPCLKCSIF